MKKTISHYKVVGLQPQTGVNELQNPHDVAQQD